MSQAIPDIDSLKKHKSIWSVVTIKKLTIQDKWRAIVGQHAIKSQSHCPRNNRCTYSVLNPPWVTVASWIRYSEKQKGQLPLCLALVTSHLARWLSSGYLTFRGAWSKGNGWALMWIPVLWGSVDRIVAALPGEGKTSVWSFTSPGAFVKKKIAKVSTTFLPLHPS